MTSSRFWKFSLLVCCLRAKMLSPQLQGSLAFLIDQLLLAAATTKTGAIDRRRILKLASRLENVR